MPTFSSLQADRLLAYSVATMTRVDNRPARPFEAALAPIPTGDRAIAEQVRAECRQQVGQPRAQIEALVAERYGEPPENATRETRDTTPTPAEPPQPGTTTGVNVGSSKPLDVLDPNLRAGARPRRQPFG